LRRLALCLAALAGLSACRRSSSSATPAATVIGPLTATPIGRSLRSGPGEAYTLTLAVGEYVEIEAVQDGLDLALAAEGPDGKTLTVADHDPSHHGREWLRLVVARAGRHRFIVRSDAALPVHSAARPLKLRNAWEACSHASPGHAGAPVTFSAAHPSSQYGG
jgi:hypothetical protein